MILWNEKQKKRHFSGVNEMFSGIIILVLEKGPMKKYNSPDQNSVPKKRLSEDQVDANDSKYKEVHKHEETCWRGGLDGFLNAAKEFDGALPFLNFGVVKTLMKMLGSIQRVTKNILRFILCYSFAY